MNPRLVVGVALGEVMLAKLEVRIEPDLAAWVAFHHGFPNLDSLFVLPGIIAELAGLNELACGTVFNDGSANGRLGLGVQ